MGRRLRARSPSPRAGSSAGHRPTCAASIGASILPTVRRLTFVVWVLALASSARAAEPGNNEEARVHVRQATAAYNLGLYLEAANEYEAAYRQTLDANLLFNIGQAYRLGLSTA